jgi:hypothetical protein
VLRAAVRQLLLCHHRSSCVLKGCAVCVRITATYCLLYVHLILVLCVFQWASLDVKASSLNMRLFVIVTGAAVLVLQRRAHHSALLPHDDVTANPSNGIQVCCWHCQKPVSVRTNSIRIHRIQHLLHELFHQYANTYLVYYVFVIVNHSSTQIAHTINSR